MESLTVLLIVLFGVLCLLLGRWLYWNPRRMFPACGLFNPEHPGIQKLGRAYGVFFIFFGIFASVAVSFSFFLRSVPGLALLAFPIAIVGAWFLRPKISQTEPTVNEASQQLQKATSAHQTLEAVPRSCGVLCGRPIRWSIANSW